MNIICEFISLVQICRRQETGDVLKEITSELMGAELLIVFVYGIRLVGLSEKTSNS
jgi:hypothetical protein